MYDETKNTLLTCVVSYFGTEWNSGTKSAKFTSNVWLPLTGTMLMLAQDAVNSYVFKLAPKSAEADVLSEKLMWGAPFPVPAHTRNKFYQAVSFICWFEIR